MPMLFFLWLPVGALITSVLSIPGRRAWVGVALLVLQLGACADRYFTHYRPIQITNAPGRPEAATLVDTTTTPQSVILITGLEWSAEFSVSEPSSSDHGCILSRTPTFTVGPVERVIANRRSKKHNRTHSLRSRP